MDDGVDLGGLDEAMQDRVRLVGPDELCSVEWHRRIVLAKAKDHLDVRVVLESLYDSPSPEGVSPGDQDALAHLNPSRCCVGP